MIGCSGAALVDARGPGGQQRPAPAAGQHDCGRQRQPERGSGQQQPSRQTPGDCRPCRADEGRQHPARGAQRARGNECGALAQGKTAPGHDARQAPAVDEHAVGRQQQHHTELDQCLGPLDEQGRLAAEVDAEERQAREPPPGQQHDHQPVRAFQFVARDGAAQHSPIGDKDTLQSEHARQQMRVDLQCHGSHWSGTEEPPRLRVVSPVTGRATHANSSATRPRLIAGKASNSASRSASQARNGNTPR